MTSDIRNRYIAATACFLEQPTAQQVFEATKRMQSGFEWTEHERKDIYNALCDRFLISQHLR